MADALTTVTQLINSPPGQLAAGGVLAGIVWKFFERVEAVLTNSTKLEIADWLRGVQVGQKVEPWPEIFTRVFDRVFGKEHLSWKCFFRSCQASYSAVVIAALISATFHLHGITLSGAGLKQLILLGIFFNILPDYFSLLESRLILKLMPHSNALGILAWLVTDLVITTGIGLLAMVLAIEVGLSFKLMPLITFPARLWHTLHFAIANAPSLARSDIQDGAQMIWVYPAFFTSIWLWLYAGSGFLLKAARRFDIGFDWFNRKFDIEKKPLQSIGLVAGALVAVTYWAAVIVSRWVK